MIESDNLQWDMQRSFALAVGLLGSHILDKRYNFFDIEDVDETRRF